jgi:UDP-galactopyranose mutase
MSLLNKVQPFVDRRSRQRHETLICFSHLRWNFVYQRPQHLMARFAASRSVLFVEEPVITASTSRLERTVDASGVEIIVPHLTEGSFRVGDLRRLLNEMLEERALSKYALWYYTPMALEWTNHLSPTALVYDCMDELTLFKGAPRRLGEWERELFKRADVVFMGGQSLFEAKREQHTNAYVFPSSIDFVHFAKGRSACADPANQKDIPHPRLGFAGVIDERMDLDLLARASAARPDWHFVLLGPVVKIDEATLPRSENIHYLGMQSYEDLPSYLGNWDVGLLPFALNESTRFLSPTKTPEYLSAGLPVVSSSIRDVVRDYGDRGLVHIADDVNGFIMSVEKALEEDRGMRLEKVDDLLANNSWARTWGRMNELLEDASLQRVLAISGPRYPSSLAPGTLSRGLAKGAYLPNKQEAS